MPDEKTDAQVASLAALGVRNPEALTPEEIKSVCASALTQAPDRPRPEEPPEEPG